MTTAVRRLSTEEAGPARPRPRTVPRTRYLPLPTGWPLYALLVCYPLWWALGLGEFALIPLAVPMAIELARRRPILAPRGFGLWLLFLCWVVISVATLDLQAPGTLEGDVTTRIIAAGQRGLSYLAVTVTVLYVGNLSEDELPRRRVVALLGIFFLELTALGCAALIWPTAEFTSPMELLLPESLASNGYVKELVHPNLAQNMAVLGDIGARPAAPFAYTNAWGNVISTLLVWFVVWWWAWGGPGRRLLAALLIGAATVPIIYSVNRGVWIGIVLVVCYVAFRLALRGRTKVLAGLVTGLVLAGAVLLVSPLHEVVAERLANPHSDAGRAEQDHAAVVGALSSPVIGYGSTRNVAGSRQSIAVGKSPSCPKCGNSSTGGAGQIWLLMFAHGLVGAALYLGYFGRVLWRHRHDHTPIGIAASAVILLSFVYMPFYGAIGMPLTLTFIAVGLLWRNASAASQTALPRGAS